MKCPICFVVIHEYWVQINCSITSEKDKYNFYTMYCPQCKNGLLQFVKHPEKDEIRHTKTGFLIPIVQKRKPLPDFIPEKYVKLYNESYSIMEFSPRASAALSRTCLQLLLREYGKVTHGKLFDEIKQVIDSKELSSELEQTIDIIRQTGNDATHPNKNENPREIILVDYEEAEWGLEILDSLFDHYIIKPHTLQKKLDEHNKKRGKEHI